MSVRYHGRRVFIGRLGPGLFVRTCIWNVSRGAVHRRWQTRTALLAWSALSFWFRSFRNVTDFVFFTDKKVFSVTSPNSGQNKVSGRLRELLKKLSVFFTSMRALTVCRCLAACYKLCLCPQRLQLFEQLINTTLCPAFLMKFVCQPLCCVPVQIHTFYQNLPSSCWLLTDTAVMSAGTNFRCHKLIAKVNK